jgi:hypothetical protein
MLSFYGFIGSDALYASTDNRRYTLTLHIIKQRLPEKAASVLLYGLLKSCKIFCGRVAFNAIRSADEVPGIIVFT